MTEWKKTSHRLAACASILVGCVTALAGADTVCAWNFNLEVYLGSLGVPGRP